jgi:hypothetical protein
MAMTNAEKQAAWRARQAKYVRDLELRCIQNIEQRGDELTRQDRQIAELKAEVERLRNQLASRTKAAKQAAGPSPEELRNLTFDELREQLCNERTPIGDEYNRRALQPTDKRNAEDLKRLKMRVAAAQPDRGGTHEASINANAEYAKFKDGLKRAEQRRAAEAAKREKRRAAAERSKAGAAAKPVDF